MISKRTLLMLGSIGLGVSFGLVVACSSSTTTPSGGGGTDAGGGDSTTGTGGSGGGTPDSSADGGGPKGYGSPCDAGTQCQSGVCFVGGGGGGGGDGGGGKTFCTERCDAGSAVTVCPSPPFSGCNMQGYCRIP